MFLQNDSGNKPRLVFLDIDTQIDFMLPEGKLYIAESRHIFRNLHRLIEYALINRILIVQTADTHAENDPEFRTYDFPAHCVAGTSGWHRVQETRLVPDLVISQGCEEWRPPLGREGVILVEKPSFSIATNPHAIRLLEALRPCHFVVFGVATEGCVRRSIFSLRELDFAVSVVIDAVAAGRIQSGEQALEEFASLSVQPLITEEICSGRFLAQARAGSMAYR
jgi:nicotinamidase/pyrazinamidase